MIDIPQVVHTYLDKLEELGLTCSRDEAGLIQELEGVRRESPERWKDFFEDDSDACLRFLVTMNGYTDSFGTDYEGLEYEIFFR